VAGWHVYNNRAELGLSFGCSVNQLIAALPARSIYVDYEYNGMTGLPAQQVNIEVIKTMNSNGGYVRCTSIWDGKFWIGHFGATNSVQGWRLFEGTAVI
jgi:hypothetical protein